LQILERPADLHTVAVDLAARHRRASQLQVARIDTAFRTFDAVRKLETGQLQEAALRASIRAYFEGEVAEGGAVVAEAEDLQGLPLRPAEPMLGADCRALLLQIEKSGQVALCGAVKHRVPSLTFQCLPMDRRSNLRSVDHQYGRKL